MEEGRAQYILRLNLCIWKNVTLCNKSWQNAVTWQFKAALSLPIAVIPRSGFAASFRANYLHPPRGGWQ